MADEQETQGEGGEKKKKPILMIAAIAGLMLLEGVGVFLFASMTGAPAGASAAGLEGLDEESGELVQEVELLKGRFQNLSTGRVWDWQVEAFLKVRKKNIEHVEKTLERRKAEIQEGMSLIFRRAQHAQLREPGLSSISRQVEAYILEVFGTDPSDGTPYVERVLIPKCDGYPSDF